MLRGQGPHLERTARDGLQPMGVHGESVQNNAEHIRDTLDRRLSPRHARFLAIPRRSDDGSLTDWYAPMDGAVSRWDSLPRDEKLSVAHAVEALVRDIDGCADKLDESGARGARMMAESVRAATYLASTEHIFIVDGAPVVSCWGQTIPTDPNRPSVLPNLSALVDAPPPPPEAPPPEEPIAVEEKRGSALPWILAALLLLLLLLLALAWWRGWITVPGTAPDFAATTPGTSLEIPESALESGDLGFLEGNWRTTSDLVSTTTGEPVVIEYALNNQGAGKSWVIETDQRCEAPVEAFFDDAVLVIQQSAPARCPDGESYIASRMTCRTAPNGPARCVAEQDGVEDVDVEMLKR